MADHDHQTRLLRILTGAIENTNEAFVTIDQEHLVVFFNRAAERMFGYDREEIVGADLRLILGPGCREGHQQAVERFKRTREPRLIGHETEFEAMRKDGRLFPASLSFSVAEIEGQLFFTAIVRDLTETRELQAQVARGERLAALGQIVAEISHEIKNPLLLIGGLAQQLLRRAEDDKSRTKLETIAGQARRLEGLLHELRDLYLPRPLAFEPIDLNGLIEEVHALVEAECRRRKIGLALRLDPATPFIRGDRGRLQQVLLNLLKNGMEALEAGGRLSIAAESAGAERVHVTVTDNGPGIPAEIRDKIFDPFFTTKRQGSGLGLAVSRRIVDEHPGASFELAGEGERGTRFLLSFPRERARQKT
jgi:two-component system, LuxR family, sensor kinase FixL